MRCNFLFAGCASAFILITVPTTRPELGVPGGTRGRAPRGSERPLLAAPGSRSSEATLCLGWLQNTLPGSRQRCFYFPLKSAFAINCRVMLLCITQEMIFFPETSREPWPGGSVGWSVFPVHQDVVGSIPSQGAYRRPPINVSLSH